MYISHDVSPYENKSTKLSVSEILITSILKQQSPTANHKVMVLHHDFQTWSAIPDPMDRCPHTLALQQLERTAKFTPYLRGVAFLSAHAHIYKNNGTILVLNC